VDEAIILCILLQTMNNRCVNLPKLGISMRFCFIPMNAFYLYIDMRAFNKSTNHYLSVT